MSHDRPAAGPVSAPVVRAELAAIRPLLDHRRLVQLVAGPGWGKTTLLSGWLADTAPAWLRCTMAHRTAEALAHELLTLRNPSERDAAVDPDDLAAAARTPDGSARLAAEVVRQWVSRGLGRVVVDDAHVLSDSPAAELLGHLAEQLDDRNQLIIAARSDPAVLADHRRDGGDVLELDATHLALDLAAVAELVDRELSPDRALAARIGDAVGGWPVAVQLLLESLRGIPAAERSAAVERLAGPDGPVGSYLRTVVLPEVAEDRRELLHVLALIEPAGAEPLAELTQRPVGEVADELATLTRQGLVRPDSAEVTRTRLAPAVAGAVIANDGGDEQNRRRTVDRVAGELASSGDADRALQLIADHGSGPAAAQVLRAVGAAALRRGALTAVCAAADRVPDEHRDEEVELLQAEALAFQGQWTRALRCLDAAGLPDEGELATASALRLGLVHHVRGDLEAALAAYERAPADQADADHAAMLGWAATADWLRGQVEAARDRAAAAMAAARAHSDGSALALAHTALALVAASDGDRHENLAQHELALAAAERADDRLLQARILTNIGSHHLEEGRLDQALTATQRAVELAEEQGFAMIIGVARCNRAAIRLQRGGIDEAIADAERAREVFERMGSRAESYAHHLIGGARLERGELALARQAYARALALGEPAGDRQALVPALIGLARADASTDPDAASRFIERALALDAGMDTAEVHVVAAWVAAAQGRTDDAAAAAQTALREARERGGRLIEAEAVTCLAVLDDDPTERLEEARSLWAGLDVPLWTERVVLGLARRAGPEGRVAAARAERRLLEWGCSPDRGTWAHRRVTGIDHRPTVVRALGSFVVERDGHPVPASAWGSRKARELLKILVVREGRPLPREELAHLLWPDQSYTTVSNRLSVALSVVRGVLGTDGDAPPPIATDDGTVRLLLDRVDLDVATFRDLAESGLTAARHGHTEDALTHLAGAEDRYTGDLLEEDPDASWARDRRTELRSLYTDVARTLARLVAIDDPELAMRLQLRILDRDPYDERAHLNLCLALMRAGRHGEAAQRYRLYRDRMVELDLPAVPFDDLRREVDLNREQAYAS